MTASYTKKWGWLAVLELALLVFSPPGWVAATGLEPSPSSTAWISVKLNTSHLGNSVVATLALASSPSTDARRLYVSSPRGTPFEASGHTVMRLDVLTEIDAVGYNPVRLESRVWFDPQSHAPLAVNRLRFGSDNYNQSYRFTTEGVFHRFQRPLSAEEGQKQPPEWTRIQHRFYPYSLETLKCGSLSETSLLLVNVCGSGAIADKGEVAFCVFHKHHLHSVRFIPEGIERIRVDYLQKSRSGALHKSETREAIRIRIETKPLNTYRGKSDEFSLLGLGEKIVLHLDRDNRIPLKVSGVVPLVGRMELSLSEVQLNR